MKHQNLRDIKYRMRAKHKALRAAVLPEEKVRRDRLILEHIVSTMAYGQARQILLYASLPTEIDTDGLFAHALAAGKHCLYPRCVQNHQMIYHYVENLDQLTCSTMGIREPAQTAPVYQSQSSDLCIVPALSYDSSGYRMGYGGGFYDRFLPGFSGVTVGICYDEDIETRLPRGRYDVRVDILMTESGIFRLR